MSEKLLLKNNNKIEDIIDSEEWKRFYNTITIPSLYEQAPEVCKRKCKFRFIKHSMEQLIFGHPTILINSLK